MWRKIIILENIRSAYNVWNCIRTADALGREVWLTGYSPSPFDNPKVKKTSLGAEDHVHLKQFNYTEDAILEAKKLWISIIAAEITPEATSLDAYNSKSDWNLAIIFWNEVEGVLSQTLNTVEKASILVKVRQFLCEPYNKKNSDFLFFWNFSYEYSSFNNKISYWFYYEYW